MAYTSSLRSDTLVRQETIARLKAFGGLKQQLWGVSFTQGPENVSAHALKPAYTSSVRPHALVA